MQLNYKKTGDTGPVIIILHGLLGSLDNWQTVARQLSKRFQVYTIDQRNHGRSPHAPEMNYTLLANDLMDFFKQQHIDKAIIIGHSMGGKVAMLAALLHPELIDKLISVDIAPVYYQGGHESILFAMAEAPLKLANKREDVDSFLQSRIHDFGVRQFILKNLFRDESGKLEWKCNLKVLIASYRFLMDFPQLSSAYNGPAYFIRGEKSDYITEDNWTRCLTLFPKAQLYSVPEAGHWVHAEAPAKFLSVLESIL